MRKYAHAAPGDGGRGMEIGRRAFLHGVAGWVVAGVGLRAVPVGGTELPSRFNGNRQAREETLRELPLAALHESVRSRIEQVVARPTIYRRMPFEVIRCDPELYLFLVRYPEVVVNMWQLMGVTRVTIARRGPYEYDARDGSGTVSQVELVYGTRSQHLFLADGYYEGPLLPRRVTGRCVLLLSSTYATDGPRQVSVTNRLDVFLQLDNAGAEIVARTLQPVLGRTADLNFRETLRFVSQVSHVAETNGPGVQRLVPRLSNIEPAVRDRFAQLATTLYQRSTASTPEELAARVGEPAIDPRVK